MELKQKKRDLERLKKFVKSVLGERADLFDIEAHFDSNLSYLENKNQIREKLRVLLTENLDEQYEKYLAELERIKVKENREAIELVSKHNDENALTDKEIDEFYRPIQIAITKLVKGFSNLVFIKGSPGTGKSFQIRYNLNKLNAQYEVYSGEVSAAYLYRILCENRDGIVWFKDVSRMLIDLRTIDLLKVATETERERIVTKSNYSKQQEDLPDRFIFRGKLIFDYNSLGFLPRKLREDFEALQSRGEFVELIFSKEDMINLLNKLAKEDWQKEVTQFLIDNHTYFGNNTLNLRTQYKAFESYKFYKESGLDWKIELKNELEREMSEARKVIYKLIGKKAIKVAELKRLLVQSKTVGSISSARRKIIEWLELEELYKVSNDTNNFYVCLIPLNQKTNGGI
jgi:hypothetical protein